MITAKCISSIEPWSGKPYKSIEVGKEYEVKSIDMGSFMTYILLTNIFTWFNSICFDFFEDGKPLDIYEDKRFNPYL